ncbi:MAG: hypothetical protein QOF48_1868 [Verrucomicrobiota bacterium]|jgi:hypothetical protein
MNKKTGLFAVVIVVALAAACTLLWHQLRTVKQRQHLAEAVAQAETASRAAHEDRLKDAERERERVDKQNKELADLTTTLRASEAKQASNVTALTRQLKAGTNGAGLPDGDATEKPQGLDFAKMMKDPAMKEMIRSQQKTMMKSIYGPLFKDLNLPADQQKKLTDLIIDTQLSGMDNVADLMGNDGASRTNAISAVAERQKSLETDIKSLLGPEKFSEYQEYHKSLSDRIILNQFQQQAAGSDTALRDDQLKSLTQMMREEREKVPAVISEDPTKTADSLAKMMNSELMEQQFKWQEEFNKRVFDRAGTLLTPDQLKEFGEFQQQQSNMQKLGLKMAREMFGADKSGGAVTVPAPVK